MSVTMDLRELQAIANRLFDHIIKTRGITSVELMSNFHWQVPDDSLFDMAKPPPELDVGSLHDDWQFVRNCLDDTKQPVAGQLSQLAPLMHYIGALLGERLAAQGG